MQNTIDGSTRIPVLVTRLLGSVERHSTTSTTPETEERRPGIYPGRRFILMGFVGPKLSAARAVRPSWGQLCAGQIVRNALLGDDGVR